MEELRAYNGRGVCKGVEGVVLNATFLAADAASVEVDGELNDRRRIVVVVTSSRPSVGDGLRVLPRPREAGDELYDRRREEDDGDREPRSRWLLPISRRG